MGVSTEMSGSPPVLVGNNETHWEALQRRLRNLARGQVKKKVSPNIKTGLQWCTLNLETPPTEMGEECGISPSALQRKVIIMARPDIADLENQQVSAQ